MAEWQTRWIQNPLPATAWGFKSLLGQILPSKKPWKINVSEVFFFHFTAFYPPWGKFGENRCKELRTNALIYVLLATTFVSLSNWFCIATIRKLESV